MSRRQVFLAKSVVHVTSLVAFQLGEGVLDLVFQVVNEGRRLELVCSLKLGEKLVLKVVEVEKVNVCFLLFDLVYVEVVSDDVHFEHEAGPVLFEELQMWWKLLGMDDLLVRAFLLRFIYYYHFFEFLGVLLGRGLDLYMYNCRFLD